ncbi:class I adenylate-forming enzyme family protein [Hyphomonas johnsonii]|uniref:Acyl-CoA synthetase n=1 Tax=Hyphomonas johnsonii MHS-2 TaxID=1280950 RepID=A0A059FUV0_9PROT|nr:class I adenylate-forming enzyme family protein [Hyphomonas johnsonii]KCZ94223.1 acyl-CoA synthetase [Hyphomonas johnsonii MHS-2]
MTQLKDETLAERLEAVLTLDPAATAIEYQGTSITWNDLEVAARSVERLLQDAGIERDAPVGWAARNRPPAVASFIALVCAGRMVVPLRPAYSVANFRDDIDAQKLKAVIGDPDDWAGEGVVDAAREAGSIGIEVSQHPFSVRFVPGLERPGPGPHREPMPDYVLERLTSGTTGAPKRIPVKQDILMPSLGAGDQKKEAEGRGELTLKSSPALLFKPFSHAGGLFGLLFSLYQARPLVLFEKFNVPEWVDAVDKYKPKAASLVPAMIRMVLDADVPPEKLDSLIAIRSGTAPLEIDVQDRFEARFNCAILVDYGAAEFIGGLAGWTLKDHKQFSRQKRGSVGRSKKDVDIRVVDPETFEPLSADHTGIVEVKSDRYGPDWIRTNDLARIDADGFIFLEGRADDAINRGGFKILPEEVVQQLRKHPGIRDAAIVGMKDERLGEVPVAAIELPDGVRDAPSKEVLDAFLKRTLPSYMVPVEYRVVDSLPRTISLKVSRPELKKMLGI